LGVAVCVPKPITTEALLHEIDLVGKPRNVLLIFSDRGFALVIERMLQTRKSTFQVRRTYDKEQALAALHEHRPDLIIMDKLMRDDSGQTFVDELHADAEQAAIPVMLFTSSRPIEGHSVESPFMLRQSEGLYPIEIFNALQGIVEGLKPRYYSL
jgi:CheY-like chemotaxis protein